MTTLIISTATSSDTFLNQITSSIILDAPFSTVDPSPVTFSSSFTGPWTETETVYMTPTATAADNSRKSASNVGLIIGGIIGGIVLGMIIAAAVFMCSHRRRPPVVRPSVGRLDLEGLPSYSAAEHPQTSAPNNRILNWIARTTTPSSSSPEGSSVFPFLPDYQDGPSDRQPYRPEVRTSKAQASSDAGSTKTSPATDAGVSLASGGPVLPGKRRREKKEQEDQPPAYHFNSLERREAIHDVPSTSYTY